MKHIVIPIKKERFKEICTSLKIPTNVEVDIVFEIYEIVCSALNQVIHQTEFYKFTPINHVVIILYIINEYIYFVGKRSNEEIKEIFKKDETINFISSLCTDKYLTNEQLNYKSQAFLDRFNPSISTLELYLNFCLRMLTSLTPTSRGEELIMNMLTNGFKLSKCIISLLLDGFETEAFSTWRTLHENESILFVIFKYGDPVLKEYMKHINYALAYRGQIPSKEKTDEIFVQIKEEMREHDLKSKDMKKFIEYGYLYAVPNIELNKDFKLNFRDGVQKLAGLSLYSKTYETASEIAHSSPLLLYSRRDYFFNLTLLRLYETFLRLELIFKQVYDKKITEKNPYHAIRKVYLSQLISIKDRISKIFASVNGKKPSNNNENTDNQDKNDAKTE